jgi:hypothetical protein
MKHLKKFENFSFNFDYLPGNLQYRQIIIDRLQELDDRGFHIIGSVYNSDHLQVDIMKIEGKQRYGIGKCVEFNTNDVKDDLISLISELKEQGVEAEVLHFNLPSDITMSYRNSASESIESHLQKLSVDTKNVKLIFKI